LTVLLEKISILFTHTVRTRKDMRFLSKLSINIILAMICIIILVTKKKNSSSERQLLEEKISKSCFD
jgi:hypothetical protein